MFRTAFDKSEPLALYCDGIVIKKKLKPLHGFSSQHFQIVRILVIFFLFSTLVCLLTFCTFPNIMLPISYFYNKSYIALLTFDASEPPIQYLLNIRLSTCKIELCVWGRKRIIYTIYSYVVGYFFGKTIPVRVKIITWLKKKKKTIYTLGVGVLQRIICKMIVFFFLIIEYSLLLKRCCNILLMVVKINGLGSREWL